MKIIVKIIFILVFFYMGFFFIARIIVEQKFSENYAASAIMADVIVVFFGGFDDNGSINHESLRRLNLALELFNRGAGKNIIFVGGKRKVGNLKGSNMLASMAMEKGIDKNRLFYDLESNDTLSNLKEAIKMIKNNKFRSILLLSSGYHLIRISYLVKPEDFVQFHYVSYNENFITPVKSLFESFKDFNYNICSHLIYLLIPDEKFKKIINFLR